MVIIYFTHTLMDCTVSRSDRGLTPQMVKLKRHVGVLTLR